MSLSGKKIIVVGDSHTDLYPFGAVLESGLRAAGADVTVLAIGGSAASSWLGTKPLCRGAAMGKPAKCQSINDVAGKSFDLAILALGTNDAANMNRASAEGGGSRSALMVKVVKQLSTLGKKLAPKVVWVGPPNVTGKIKWYTQDAVDALYASVPSGTFDYVIDSRPLTGPGLQTDGVHPYGESGRSWAQGVLYQLQSVDVPSGSDAKPVARITGLSGPGVAAFAMVAVALFLVRRRLFRA